MSDDGLAVHYSPFAVRCSIYFYGTRGQIILLLRDRPRNQGGSGGFLRMDRASRWHGMVFHGVGQVKKGSPAFYLFSAYLSQFVSYPLNFPLWGFRISTTAGLGFSQQGSVPRAKSERWSFFSFHSFSSPTSIDPRCSACALRERVGRS